MAALTAVGGIVVILLAIVIGPTFSPPEFSWLHHTTSEQAGQHMPGAWIMRAGFVSYGFGTLLAAIADWSTRPLVRAALALFGAGLIATAIWSNASILPAAFSDRQEDWLHSVASGVVGTAFSAACAARLFGPNRLQRDYLSVAGLIVSVAIPLAMGRWPEFRGVLQRAMFCVSFIFVAREFTSSARRFGSVTAA
jgi:NAD(P)-dependent dehydrogenase (short-subunit alcohol dehydrogenase family)